MDKASKLNFEELVRASGRMLNECKCVNRSDVMCDRCRELLGKMWRSTDVFDRARKG